MSFVRALRIASITTLVTVASGSCTTRETGSIDLIPIASTEKPPKTPPCATDQDCPGDPKHRVCRIGDGTCVECLVSDDCADRPEPVCDAKGHCVLCRPEEPSCADAATEPPGPPPPLP